MQLECIYTLTWNLYRVEPDLIMNSTLFSLLTIFLFNLSLFGYMKSDTKFSIHKIAELPPANSYSQNSGVAGAFSGITGSKLIIAGGSNFPDKKPWEGGIKTFYDKIYVYSLTKEGAVLADKQWSLPNEIAYGTSVTLPNGILAIGGNNSAKCFNSVYLLKWDVAKNDLEIVNYPALPVPISYASAVLLGNSVYLIGGSGSPDSHDTGSYFMKLDLSKRTQTNFEWEILPSFPGKGRIFSVAAAQSDGNHLCLFLFSGRNVSSTNEVTVFDDGLIFDPERKTWEAIQSQGSINFPVMAGTAFSYGKSEIVLAGGATASFLYQEVDLKTRLKNAISSQDTAMITLAKKALLNYYTGHPGFSKDILVYNTKTKTLSQAGKFDEWGPVTTNAVSYQNGAIITCGEIKPGIRTPDIIQISPIKKASSFYLTVLAILFISLGTLISIIYLIFNNRRKQPV